MPMPEGQKQLVFFPENANPPDAEARQTVLDPDNPMSPYYGMIGNRKALKRLIRLDFNALGQYNHDASNLNVAILGPTGTGKTEVARRHMRANRLPSVELHPKAVRRVQDVFEAIQEACANANIPLVEMGRENNYICPPVNVFIDEVHGLAGNIVNGLLKATERKDHTLVTEEGITLDTQRVHWIIGTTERGKLFDAFDTRFIKIVLGYYGKEEIATIVRFNHPELPQECCRLVAHYAGKIPREALDFAEEMKLEQAMNPEDWQEVAHKIAKENDIDQHGMTGQRLKVLTALANGPVASPRLPYAVGVKIEELEKYILPWLLESTEEIPALVQVTPRGYSLTETGINELNKRNIPNKGKTALAA